MFLFPGIHCAYRLLLWKDLCLLFPIGGGLLISLHIKQPSIWGVMNIPQVVCNPRQRVPSLKLCLHPKIYTYTQGIGKNNSRSHLAITPSQGGHTRAQASFLGHIPSTRSRISNSLRIYCPWTYHVPFFNPRFHPGLPLTVMDTICLLSIIQISYLIWFTPKESKLHGIPSSSTMFLSRLW